MNVLKTISLSIEILTLVLSLVACSGGGSSSTTPPPVVPVAPPTTTQPTSPSCSETVTEGPFDSVFPSVEWEVRTPESQGICSDGFDDVVDYAFGEGTGTASFLIIKNGYLIFEEYADDVDADTLATSWSVAKSIVSTTVGTSIDDGYISNTDIFASTHLNEWDDSPKDQITLYHLLSLRTGLAQVVATDLYFSADMLRFSLDRELIGSPGEVLYDYSNADVVLTGELVTRAVDEPISTYFQHRIGDRIGLNSEWWYDAQDTDLAYCCIDANPREFARWGLLMARGGVWRGEQVISEDWVSTSTSPAKSGTYRYYWWPLTRNGFGAFGLNSQIVAVYPDDDLVILRFSTYERLGDGSLRRAHQNGIQTPTPQNFDNATFLNSTLDVIYP